MDHASPPWWTTRWFACVDHAVAGLSASLGCALAYGSAGLGLLQAWTFYGFGLAIGRARGVAQQPPPLQSSSLLPSLPKKTFGTFFPQSSYSRCDPYHCHHYCQCPLPLCIVFYLSLSVFDFSTQQKLLDFFMK